MWLNIFMDDFHFNNIAKMSKKNLYLIILGKIKACNSFKNGHKFYITQITLLKNVVTLSLH